MLPESRHAEGASAMFVGGIYSSNQEAFTSSD
jgi:hypothetical protein